MNVTAFIAYLNNTKGLHLDAAYYGRIETWRQWWQGDCLLYTSPSPRDRG